uniref:Uncharacterized protein n=1 Tax=Promethearchaeum syntrophicum TaxID=2594042 RepID=A0A5B9DBJ8_9ARCH|nr:hypothetical protein DSAG12_01949 [Candidatus Prometheoarchaeum syntrophicum]
MKNMKKTQKKYIKKNAFDLMVENPGLISSIRV